MVGVVVVVVAVIVVVAWVVATSELNKKLVLIVEVCMLECSAVLLGKTLTDERCPDTTGEGRNWVLSTEELVGLEDDGTREGFCNKELTKLEAATDAIPAGAGTVLAGTCSPVLTEACISVDNLVLLSTMFFIKGTATTEGLEVTAMSSGTEDAIAVLVRAVAFGGFIYKLSSTCCCCVSVVVVVLSSVAVPIVVVRMFTKMCRCRSKLISVKVVRRRSLFLPEDAHEQPPPPPPPPPMLIIV